MSDADKKADDLEVPFRRSHLDPDAVTPVQVPVVPGFDRRGGLGVTIGFSTTGKWMSAAIRWITGAKVSHAWIAYDDYTLGLRMVMQAEAWGFEVRPWKRWRRENKLVAEFRLIDLPSLRALQHIAALIGAEYDYASAIWSGLCAWFRRWSKSKFSLRPSRSPRKLMCSESVIRFLKEAGSGAVQELDEETTSPGELLDIVRKSTEFVPVRR